MNGADRVVSAKLLLYNKIKLGVIAVALCFDEVFDKRETALLQTQVVILGASAPGRKILDQ